METNNKRKKIPMLSGKAIMSFFISLSLCAFIVCLTILNKQNVDKLSMEHLILEKSIRINEVISRLIYKTNSLATMIHHEDGDVDDFNKIARTIVDDPAILNVLVAPNGIVSNVYPMENNNEAVIGWNFFNESLQGNKEAIETINSGRLFLGGPFKSAQGSEVLVGRLPVYIDTETEKQKFWGLVSITLKFPQALDGAELGIFKTQGFAYELWRINPDTNERQVILSNYENGGIKSRIVEKHIQVFTSDWYLIVWPIRAWYSHPENWALIIASFLISLLVLFVLQNNFELKQMKVILEDMAKSDPLTGIYNRRHFMESLQMDLERVRRQKENCFIIILDMDKFKSVNDTYGHIMGDKVLIETASRIKSVIRPYDLFARYGGEEFIIYATRAEKKDIIAMVERLRLSICDKIFEYKNVCLTLSASFGIAHIDDYNIEKAILHADKALYKAKNEGRNKAIFFE